MKTSILLTGIVLLIHLGGCTAPAYVPKPANVDLSARGSYITLNVKGRESRNTYIKGELIAVSDEKVYILKGKETIKQLDSVRVDHIRHYKFRFAKPSRFNWSVPIYSLASISHGWFIPISTPINILLTSIIAGGPGYKYNQTEIPIGLLNRYARFPQGIPEGLDKQLIE